MKFSPEVIGTGVAVLAAIVIVMVVRDNLPNKSFSFKKG